MDMVLVGWSAQTESVGPPKTPVCSIPFDKPTPFRPTSCCRKQPMLDSTGNQVRAMKQKSAAAENILQQLRRPIATNLRPLRDVALLPEIPGGGAGYGFFLPPATKKNDGQQDGGDCLRGPEKNKKPSVNGTMNKRHTTSPQILVGAFFLSSQTESGTDRWHACSRSFAPYGCGRNVGFIVERPFSPPAILTRRSAELTQDFAENNPQACAAIFPSSL